MYFFFFAFHGCQSFQAPRREHQQRLSLLLVRTVDSFCVLRCLTVSRKQRKKVLLSNRFLLRPVFRFTTEKKTLSHGFTE